MRSPFPGVDPYLVQFWNGIQHSFVVDLADELNQFLPPRYRASLNEREIFENAEPPSGRNGSPEFELDKAPVGMRSKYLVPRARNLMRREFVPVRQHFIEIVGQETSAGVVTSIEVLSPISKRPGDGMAQFKMMQSNWRNQQVNRIVMDFLHDGQRVFSFPAQTRRSKRTSR